MKYYAEGGGTQFQAGKELTSQIGEVAQVPGGIEMLMTMAAEQLGGQGEGKTKQVRLYNLGGPVGYEEGGLAEAAELTRSGGRGDDEMLVHMSPEEYEAIVAMWGEPDINPDTGIPEYGFLSKLWKGIKKTVKKIVKSPLFSMIAPMALNFFVPGAGAALGGMLGASGKAAATIGNTLIRSGAGALSGGKKGALAGAVSGLTSGGVGSTIGSKLGLSGEAARYAGNAVIGGAGSSLGGGSFGEGALGSVSNSLMQPTIESGFDKGMEKIFGPQGGIPGQTGGIGDATGTGQMSPIPGGPQMSPIPPSGDLTVFGNPQQSGGFLSRAGDWIKENPLLAAGAGLAVAGSFSGSPAESQPPQLPSQFNQGITPYDFNRAQQPLPPPADYFTYGQVGSAQEGEHQFFNPNTIGQPSQVAPSSGGGGGGVANPNELQQMMQSLVAAGGGRFSGGGHSRGVGSGRDDTIEAMLSDGEYVMDAETVSMLGDGSNDEGAARLDEMREELRKHKGQNLVKGKFSSNARRPLEYLKGGEVPNRSDRSMGRTVNRSKSPYRRRGQTRMKQGGGLREESTFEIMAREARGET